MSRRASRINEIRARIEKKLIVANADADSFGARADDEFG